MNFNNGAKIPLCLIKDFAYQAKIASFARTDEKTVLTDNTSIYSYRNFNDAKYAGLIYSDIYNGNIVEGGQETISFDLFPVWRNQYYGGVRAYFFSHESSLSDLVSSLRRVPNVVTAFLKKALLATPKEFPVRGQKRFEASISEYEHDVVKGQWLYTNEWEGIPLFDIDDAFASFSGYEKIFFNGNEVYWHSYHGGLVLDKYFPIYCT